MTEREREAATQRDSKSEGEKWGKTERGSEKKRIQRERGSKRDREIDR